jgi:hypothetical protein
MSACGLDSSGSGRIQWWSLLRAVVKLGDWYKEGNLVAWVTVSFWRTAGWDYSKGGKPLQNPTPGVLSEGGGQRPRKANCALVNVRHRAEGCMARRWWQQCRKRSLRGTGQHPVVCMPSTRMGLCWWWLFNYPLLVGLIWTTRKKKEPSSTGASTDSPFFGRCYTATETASNVLCECVALADFISRRLGKRFYGTKRLWWDSVM